MAVIKWVCETCDNHNFSIPWDCPGCNIEVCDNCFWSYGHCKECCEGKTENELRLAANETGNFDFEVDHGSKTTL